LLLCQEPRVLSLIGVPMRIFVDELLLREALVRLRLVFDGQTIVLFEERVNNACRSLATVLGARRHFAGGVRREGGFATMAVVSAFEDYLRLFVST
jgi:hypothetical protein